MADRVTRVTRGEPAAELFVVPPDYHVVPRTPPENR